MSINILLADDSITIQKVIGIIFGGEEYSLSIVDNGMAVLDKARQTAPDILLIDALMPGMSGYEVCELVRATPELAHKPILLLTGSFEPFDEDKAKSCGADDFIAKPFESQQIIAKVKELCEVAAKRSTQSTQISTGPGGLEPIVAPAIQAAAATPIEDDIWGAFTAAPETTSSQPLSQSAESDAFEPDVFDLINEEPSALFTAPSPPPPLHTPESTPPQWTSVDENFFEFTEETPAETPSPSLSQPSTAMEEVSFGDISFESPKESENIPFQSAPVAAATSQTDFPEITKAFEEFPTPVFETSAPEIPTHPATVERENPPTPTALADQPTHSVSETAVPLSEEQIKAAIAGLSKEVIERIVWEVVPDLAENLIIEAIRKIREGR
ncbi:response regulator [Pelotalea chapellei]|uniref:Response regulator n=1 Tax=Pelotalea chapellei TaxID=44671 RepID=A0ABS5UCD1_9BACT|nr:response regulator [Pelotalea chapellei]MBT1073352.1 response regulator [Pelotalea chapellei]